MEDSGGAHADGDADSEAGELKACVEAMGRCERPFVLPTPRTSRLDLRTRRPIHDTHSPPPRPPRELECAVCLCVLEDPVSLPCNHPYCNRCLVPPRVGQTDLLCQRANSY